MTPPAVADGSWSALRAGSSATSIPKRATFRASFATGAEFYNSLLGPIIREEKPAKVNIDVGGLGIGIYERLIERGYDSSVFTAVNFGGKPLEPPPLDE